MAKLINIPTVFVIRGGSGSGKTSLCAELGKSYKSWCFINQVTRENLKDYRCVAISGDAVYGDLFGQPVDPTNLDLYSNSDIYYSQLEEYLQIALKHNPIAIILEGITLYKYYEKVQNQFRDQATFLQIEMVDKNAYSLGKCFYNKNGKIVSELKEQVIGQQRPEMYLNAYQYFPDLKYQKTYSSNSPEKYKSLNLPDLTGKKALDIGCNLGYFTINYRKNGAAQSDGLDVEESFVIKASKFKNIMYELDGIDFYSGSILDFREKSYDLISALSIFHYFREQQRLVLERVHALLNPGGIFVLELGMSQKNEDMAYTEKYQRSVDLTPCFFPNKLALDKLIEGLFSIEYFGNSVFQSGDALPRFVVHLKKL